MNESSAAHLKSARHIDVKHFLDKTNFSVGKHPKKGITMKKNNIRIISFILAAVIAATSFATAAFAAPAVNEVPEERVLVCESETTCRIDEPEKGYNVWLTGCFNGNNWSSAHRFRIYSNSKPQFKVYTYNRNGKGTSSKFDIRVTTPQDRSYSKVYYHKSNGNTITLDRGYTIYDIQIERSCFAWGSSNVANCYYWAFKATSRKSEWQW